MKRLMANGLRIGIVCTALAATLTVRLPAAAIAADNNPAVMQADHALVEALTKADKSALAKLLYTDFMWTNSAGDTLSKAKVLQALPKPPLGDESSAQITEYTYGQIGEVRAISGNEYILRIWVKSPAGWRILAYHETKLADRARPGGGPSANDCDNPCNSVPYTAKNDAEKGIFASWAGLELALTTHDVKAWSPHFPEEYLMANSGTPVPITKADRIGAISKPGPESNCKIMWAVGRLCEPQLAARPPARFFHFGDTVVIISEDKPYAGKPQHNTRIWHRDPKTGIWQMMESWASTIESAPAVVPRKS